jgi:hypothetical protein
MSRIRLTIRHAPTVVSHAMRLSGTAPILRHADAACSPSPSRASRPTRDRVLSQALTPALALDYVRELSADVRAAIVLDAEGALLAGPPQLAGPARALLEAGGDAAELEAVSDAGVVCAVRSPGHSVVAVCGRFAIPGVVRQDLRAAVAALEGRAPGEDEALEARPGAAPESGGGEAPEARPGEAPGSPPDEPLERAAGALISAAQRDFDA